MYNIKPVLSKVANIGLYLLLINNGADQILASSTGAILETALTGITIKDSDNLQKKLYKILERSFSNAIKKVNLELQYEVVNNIIRELFNTDKLYDYLDQNAENALSKNLIILFDKYKVPYKEQSINVSLFSDIMLKEVNEQISKDRNLTLISILYHIIYSSDKMTYLIAQNEKIIEYIKSSGTKIKKNRKDELIKKWNEELFLHKNKNVRLRDLYFQPRLRNTKQNHESNIDENIWGFIDSSLERLLLILGNPGLGKSSSFCYMADKFKEYENFIFIQMRELDSSIAYKSLIAAITTYLECSTNNLENKVLFLDGYDELRVDNKHYDLCLEMIPEIRAISNLKVIMSTRKNYIDLDKISFEEQFSNIVVLELMPFEKRNMLEYIKNFQAKTGNDKNDLYLQFRDLNIDANVFGVPFILYLVCSSEKMNIKSIRNLFDIYSQVFAFQGGVYDRIYDGENRLEYDAKRKKELIKLTQDIAYMMFNRNDLKLPIDELEKYINSQYPQRIKDYAIANYYDIDNNNILFVHKTFQEFFACSYITHKLEDILDCYLNNGDKTIFVNSMLKLFFCDNYLFIRIEEELIYHLQKSKLISEKYIDVFKNNIHLLFDYVLLYYENTSKSFIRFQNCFSSFCKIAQMIIGDYWCGTLGNNYAFILFIKIKGYVNIELNGISMKNIDLSGSTLRRSIIHSDFTNCNLCRIDLKKTIIIDCSFNTILMGSIYASRVRFSDTRFSKTTFDLPNLERGLFENCNFQQSSFNIANLENSRFLKTLLVETDFIKTNCSQTIFKDTEFRDVKFKGSNLSFANFDCSNFSNVIFENCIFQNTVFRNINRFENVNFTNVTFIDCRFIDDQNRKSEVASIIETDGYIDLWVS